MKLTGLTCMGISLVLIMFAHTAMGATVSLDVGQRYQTITGFGTFGELQPREPDDTAFIGKAIDELGLTALRLRVPPQLSTTPFTADTAGTGELELSHYNHLSNDPQHDVVHTWFETIRAVKQVADSRGKPVLFIAEVWSPPAWMKMNENLGGEASTNRLEREHYDEFAEFLEAYVQIVKQEYGVDIHSICPQDEPQFSQSWESCVYSSVEYRELVRAVGDRFRRRDVDVGLRCADDVFRNTRNYLRPVLNDTSTARYVDYIALHGGSQDSAEWARMYAWASSHGKPLWQASAWNYEDSWDGAMRLGRNMVATLKYGRVSLWNYYQLVDRWNTLGLTYGETITAKWYVSSHVYRFVRPGAVQIGSACDVDSVLVAAFVHESDRSLAVVLVNQLETATHVQLNGSGLPGTYTGYVSTDAEKMQTFSLAAGDSVELPASSVTTLYADDYTVHAVPYRVLSSSSASARARPWGCRWYTLDGRLLNAGTQRLVPPSAAGMVIGKPQGRGRLLLPFRP